MNLPMLPGNCFREEMTDTSVPERHRCTREPKPEGCNGHIATVVIPCDAYDDGHGHWVWHRGWTTYSHDKSHGEHKAEIGKG